MGKGQSLAPLVSLVLLTIFPDTIPCFANCRPRQRQRWRPKRRRASTQPAKARISRLTCEPDRRWSWLGGRPDPPAVPHARTQNPHDLATGRMHIIGVGSQYKQHWAMPALPNWQPTQGRRWLLRVRPISSSRITEFSQHEANGCEAQEDQAAEVDIFPVLGKPAATIEPRNGALDDPSARQNDEAFGPIGTLDDFGFELCSDLGQRRMEDRPRIRAIGKEPF